MACGWMSGGAMRGLKHAATALAVLAASRRRQRFDSAACGRCAQRERFRVAAALSANGSGVAAALDANNSADRSP
jgi:hypothetical protein